MKKILIFALSILICMVFCSCGGNDPVKDDSYNKDYVTFYIRTYEDWSQDFTRWAVNEYNKQVKGDDLRVKLTLLPDGDYATLLTTGRESNKLPDIIVIDMGAMYNYYKQGYFTSLNDLIGYDYLEEDVEEYAKLYTKFNGNYYGYPWMSEPNSMFVYRKDMLSAAGFDIPENNIWTWDDVLEACSKLVKATYSSGKKVIGKGQYCFGMPYNMEANTELAGLARTVTKKDVLSDDWLTSNMGDDWIPFYSFIYDLYAGDGETSYAAPANLAESAHKSIAALCENKCAMTFCGSWAMARVINEYPEVEDVVGFACIPTQDGNIEQTTSVNGGWNYCISCDSKYPEQAAKFLRFLNSSKICCEYMEKSCLSRMSPLKSVQAYVDEHVEDKHPEWTSSLKTVLRYIVNTPSHAQEPLSQAFQIPVETIQKNYKKIGKIDLVNQVIGTAKSNIQEWINNQIRVYGEDGAKNPNMPS